MKKRKRQKFLMIALSLLITGIDAPVFAQDWQEEKIHPGDILEFGEYGTNIITWYVLDKSEGEALLLSENILDCMPYHTTFEETAWKDSSLRAWLNGPFYMEAFTEGESRRIVEKNLENEPNKHYKTDGGEWTWDNVFVLSEEEASKYFENRDDRMAKVTKSAEEAGIYVSELTDTGFWWLRTPGEEQDNVMCVGIEGTLVQSGYPVCRTDFGVRPAVWVRLD